MSPKFPPSTARQAELAIRALALLCAALGAPVLALTAAASGHPLLALGSLAASGPLAVARLIAPPEDAIARPARNLQIAEDVPDHREMDTIKPLLLSELRAIQLSPNALQIRLKDWGHDIPVASIVEELRHLHDKGLVDGPGISLLHHQPVWLTTSGQARARELRHGLGGWRQVA